MPYVELQLDEDELLFCNGCNKEINGPEIAMINIQVTGIECVLCVPCALATEAR